MVNYLLPERFDAVAGLGWLQQWRYGGMEDQPLASAIFGDYTSLVYLTPILGGIIADRWLGRRAALIAGGAIMALGHFLMAFEGAFLFALTSLIVGVGLDRKSTRLNSSHKCANRMQSSAWKKKKKKKR